MTPSEVVHLVGGSRHPMVPLPGHPPRGPTGTASSSIHRIPSHLLSPLLAIRYWHRALHYSCYRSYVPSQLASTIPWYVLVLGAPTPHTLRTSYKHHLSTPGISSTTCCGIQTHDLILGWHISRYHHIWGTPDPSDPEIHVSRGSIPIEYPSRGVHMGSIPLKPRSNGVPEGSIPLKPRSNGVSSP